MKKTNKLISILLVAALLLSMAPLSLTAFASANDKVFIGHASIIHLKGNAATIEAGTKANFTKIKIGNEYIDFSKYKYSQNGEAMFTLGDSNYEADLSGSKITGAQSNSMTGDVNITMTGGVVKILNGSCSDPGSVLTGNVNITMTGGKVNEIWGAEYDVDGNVNITVTGGTVSTFIYLIYRGDATVSGDCRVTITGGSPGTIDRCATTGNINGATNLYSTVLPYGHDKNNFTNFIYRDGSNWKSNGNTVTALNGQTLTIASGQTATVDSGKTLSGTIVNNGTISVKNGGTLSGTIANKGTIWGYGNISGVTNSGSGKIIKKVTASGTNVTFNDSAWQNNTTNYDDAYTATLTPTSGYALPSSVTVKVGGSDLEASNYTYNCSTGVLSIPAAKITADTTVSVTVLLDLSSPALTVETEHTAYTYTGSKITPAIIVNGEKLGENDYTAVYTNNIDCGTASVTITGKGNCEGTTTKTFEIKEANISDATVTLNPTSGTYTGTAYNPSVSVTLDGFGTLVEGTDYTLSWDKNGFITPETYTVRVVGIGNFTGYVDKTFNINAADLDDVEVRQIGTLTYNGGDALTPTVSANAIAVNNQPITFTYCTEQNGIYGSLPSFTEAGTYTVYYKATAPNHNEATGSFTVIVNKAIVTEPTIASKPYTGSAQTADITDTELYTVVKNDGGTGVKENGCYDVVLELKNSANYKWSTTDNAQVTLQFKITRAENEWTVTPSITGWTYGEAAKAPVGEAKFGEVSVEYSGTTNGGATYSSTTAPTDAGSYKATFIVQETEDYKGLETSVDFTIAKADYNMRGAKWNYREPFKYDGKEHKVEVVGLPTGVTVESYENNTATAVGDYYAEVNLTYDAHNYNAPTISKLGWTIYNDWSPTEYTATTPNGNGWLNSDFVITANDGHKVSLTNTADGDWKDALTYSGETADGSVTFCLKNETDGTISLAKTITYKLDKTAPTGKVEFVNRNAWEEFVNTITFGLFFKDEVTVKATANDTLSGVDKIEYALASKAMTLDEVKGITDWTEYTDSFGVTLEDAKTFVYFVRITDKAGNVTYLSTDGAEYDTTAPVINGAENGKTYYTTQKVTVTEKNVDTITLNGNPATENITLAGNKEAIYTIVVTDKAGNTTTVTVTMKPIKELAKATENLGNDNVTSADAPALKELVEILDELIADPDTSDDGEKETLEQHKTIAESLLETIEAAAEATDTENVGKVENVTPENVTPENKTDLENAKADLEKALKENSGNYTEDEKKAIEDEIKRIDDALEVIDNVEEVEETISKLPAVDTVKPDDEEAIKAITDAQTAYNALSDYEKSLVDEAAKAKLDKLVAALVAYDIVEGDGSSWTEDSDHNITFVVNGLFSKFVGIKVDGKDVDKTNYEAKAGSTIITLKASYLDTLAVGEHTISVVYTDGSTDGTFDVHAKTNSPATGDNSHMFLWIALLFISGGAVITLTVVERKRRMASNR